MRAMSVIQSFHFPMAWKDTEKASTVNSYVNLQRKPIKPNYHKEMLKIVVFILETLVLYY